MEVAWVNYVYEVLASKPSDVAHRLAKVVLAMSVYEDGAVFALPELLALTPEIEEIYREMNPKTLRRDVRRLVEAHLLEAVPEGSSRPSTS